LSSRSRRRCFAKASSRTPAAGGPRE
jgi:hypothetical protein